MRLTPRRAAAALALTASVLLPTGAAYADSSVYCLDQPAVYLGGDVTMQARKFCVPWPFSL